MIKVELSAHLLLSFGVSPHSKVVSATTKQTPRDTFWFTFANVCIIILRICTDFHFRTLEIRGMHLVLFCKSVAEAEQLLNIINDTCLHFGLTISFKKTKTQVFNNTLLASESLLFSIGGNIIENIRSFVYLGQSTSNEEKGCFTEHRIARATAKFNEFQKVLTDSRVTMYTGRKILYASVRSRLTFGTQACLPKEHQMKKLEACWSV